MDHANNPWIEVLGEGQDESTAGIASYFEEQIQMLFEASCGKINGVFAETDVVNRSITPTFEPLRAQGIVHTLGAMSLPPMVDLLDADKMYERRDYCFEIRSDKYRFRLLTLVMGPMYPVAMRVDRGVCEDLADTYDRFDFPEQTPCELLVADDADLDKTFRLLLQSKKVKYICNRLMGEAE